MYVGEKVSTEVVVSPNLTKIKTEKGQCGFTNREWKIILTTLNRKVQKERDAEAGDQWVEEMRKIRWWVPPFFPPSNSDDDDVDGSGGSSSSRRRRNIDQILLYCLREQSLWTNLHGLIYLILKDVVCSHMRKLRHRKCKQFTQRS